MKSIRSRLIIPLGILAFPLFLYNCSSCPDDLPRHDTAILGVDVSVFDLNNSGKFDRILFSVRYTTVNISSKQVNATWNFIPSAFATDCPEPESTILNPIDSVFITTDRIYNADVGNDVTGLFVTGDSTPVREKMVSCVDCQQTFFSTTLTAPPDSGGSFIFTYKLVDVNGDTFNTTTDPVIIRP